MTLRAELSWRGSFGTAPSRRRTLRKGNLRLLFHHPCRRISREAKLFLAWGSFPLDRNRAGHPPHRRSVRLARFPARLARLP